MTPTSLPNLERAPWLSNVARLETVKWLAFVSMVCDHIDLALFDRSVPFLHSIGAFAFPAFCLAFGLGLARSGDLTRAGWRLMPAAALAQLAWFGIADNHPANVLMVFGACAFVLGAPVTRGQGVALSVLLLATAGMVAEGGMFGVLLVFGAFAAGRIGRWWPFWLVAGVWVALVPLAGACVAVLAVALWPSSGPTAPRVRGLLAWGYPGHLGILAAGRAIFL